MEFSGGYPFFIQEFGSAAWDAAALSGASEISEEHARTACEDATRSLDATVYRARRRLATTTELRYLTAMASLGTGPYAASDVDDAMGGDYGWALSRLIDKGILYRTSHGFSDFTIPGFGDYLRRLDT